MTINGLVWIGTQSEFDDLLVLDENIIYIIVEEDSNNDNQ